MQVWDWGGNGYLQYQVPTHESPMGYVAENSVIQGCLVQQLERDRGRVDLLWPAEIVSLQLPDVEQAARHGGGGPLACLTLRDGGQILARLVIAADGARSFIRHLAGMRTMERDYRQRALVATVRTAEANGVAWQRFLETGPLALLPVRDGFSNIVWSTTPAEALRLQKCPPSEFAAEVNVALQGGTTPPLNSFIGRGGEAGFWRPPWVEEWVGSPPNSFPLAFRAPGRYVRSRLVLIGDAAHAVHPLAGQGVNLGFGDVRALANALASAVETGRDIGDATLLEEEYEQPRQRSNMLMIGANRWTAASVQTTKLACWPPCGVWDWT
eukprot:jgi/Botrbrau1/2090/Bobra.0047s0048.1